MGKKKIIYILQYITLHRADNQSTAILFEKQFSQFMGFWYQSHVIIIMHTQLSSRVRVHNLAYGLCSQLYH